MKRGFTLVELLAVIVILAIILAITIPGISNVISSSRLNSFNASSKMLGEAAKTYISINNITVVDGATVEILYSDIKNAGYISKIVDPINNNECIHSKVYVTNTSGTFAYKGALVCDNYIDIDAYNLVTNGDFNNGTTGWACLACNFSTSNNILSVTGNGTSTAFYPRSFPPFVSNHKYYYRAFMRITDTLCTQFIIIAFGTTDSSISLPAQNQWYKMQGIMTNPTSGQLQLRVSYTNAATANGKIMQVDGNHGVYALDLTSIYGSGNEPTVAELDNIMSNMGK